MLVLGCQRLWQGKNQKQSSVVEGQTDRGHTNPDDGSAGEARSGNQPSLYRINSGIWQITYVDDGENEGMSCREGQGEGDEGEEEAVQLGRKSEPKY